MHSLLSLAAEADWSMWALEFSWGINEPNVENLSRVMGDSVPVIQEELAKFKGRRNRSDTVLCVENR